MEIRPLATDEDFEACAALQQQIWGDDIREMVPPALLKICQRVGGIAAGAYDLTGRLAGFVFGITGIADGELVHWSHILAVRPEFRDRSVGRSLKAYQREQLRAIGVKTALWTYDPLVARNAYLNLSVLGATIEQYVEDMYGAQPTSKTDQIIGSDRVVVRWNLESPHSEATSIDVEYADEAPPVRPRMSELPQGALVRIEIPRDIHRLKDERAAAAREWRAITRRAFQHYLSRGYCVTRFVRRDAPHESYYLLQAAPSRGTNESIAAS